jgi:ABC-type nitrate/sulfonate/bicarbonate transport system substrate-binding protein
MRFLIVAFTVMLCGLLGLTPAMAEEPVRLQLKWRHAFQFAGYYAAKELGYYAQAGLDVQLSEAEPDIDPLDEVLSGRADFGVGTSSLLLARKAGQPVVVLAVVFQHSPQVLIASRLTAGQSIHDLAGKRIMLEPQSEELLAYLKREGIASGNIKLIKHNFSSKSLIDGSAEAVSAYSTVEPYQLDLAGFAYQIYTPRSAGIDFYGDNLFTTEEQLRLHPARVKAFRAASLRGWHYAMEHPDEIIELILSKYSSAGLSADARSHFRSQLQFEARQMVGLMRTDLIEVGYMNPGRWRHIADTYNEIGMLPADFSLEGFLYETDLESDLLRLRSQLIAAVALVAHLRDWRSTSIASTGSSSSVWPVPNRPICNSRSCPPPSTRVRPRY